MMKINKIVSMLLILALLLCCLPAQALAQDSSISDSPTLDDPDSSTATDPSEPSTSNGEMPDITPPPGPEDDDVTLTAEGICGENLTWTLTSNGILTISGTGPMDDFPFRNYGSEAPWSNYCKAICQIIIEEGITTIGNGAFADCISLTSVSIPEGVVSIGSDSFYYCDALSAISLPQTLETIGESAFAGCSALSALALPDSLKQIGAYVFWECYLKELYIGPNVTAIGYGAFDFFPVWIDADNANYLSDEYGCVYTKDMTTLLHAKDIEGTFFVPDTVTTIQPNACAFGTMTTVVIPPSVTCIHANAFYECGAELVVFLGNAPELTDSFVFAGPLFYYPAQDSSWTEEVRKSVCWMYETTWAPLPDIAILRQPEFVETTNGKTVTISTEALGKGLSYEWWVRSPGASDFCSTGIVGQEYSTVVTTHNAGQRVYCLITDENGNSVKTDVVTLGFYPELKLGEIITARTDEEYAYAFVQFTPTMTCRYTFRTLYDWYNNSYKGKVCDVDGNVLFDQDEDTGTDFQITCQLEAGKTYLFGIRSGYATTSEEVILEGHNLVATVTREPSCTQTGEISYSCDLCENTWSEVLPLAHDYVNGFCSSCGAARIVTGVCGPDLDFKLEGDTLTIWGTGVMSGDCYNSSWDDYKDDIKKVIITEGVTSIGDGAFSSCGNLTQVTIPGSVETIGDSAFRHCTSLKEATIPEGVKVIKSDAFCGAAIYAVVIPHSVTTIEYTAFCDCPNLTDIFIGAGTTDIDNIAPYCPNLKGIWVDKDNAAYCNDEHGVLFSKDKATLYFAPVTISGDYTIPDGVKTIEAEAFQDCVLLRSVTIPDSILRIDYGAFSDCTGLTQVIFGNNKPDMNNYCFENVTATVIYPAESENWSHYDMNNYGGTLLWVDTNGSATNYEISGANVALGNSLTMNFFVDKNYIAGEDYYAQIIHYTDEDSYVYIIPYQQWEEREDYMVIPMKNLAAKQMADLIDVRIYHGDGAPASHTWTDCICDYISRIFDQQDDKTKTLLVDMLNYGLAARTYFGYSPYEPQCWLSDEQLSYGTQSITCADQRVQGDNYCGSTLVLENRIQLTMYFRNVTAEMYAVVSYTNHYGEICTHTVSGTDFAQYNSDIFGVTVDTLAVADGDQLVTVTVYDADENAVASATDTVNGYLSRMMSGDEIFEAVAKFTKSAYAYFHQN